MPNDVASSFNLSYYLCQSYLCFLKWLKPRQNLVEYFYFPISYGCPKCYKCHFIASDFIDDSEFNFAANSISE